MQYIIQRMDWHHHASGAQMWFAMDMTELNVTKALYNWSMLLWKYKTNKNDNSFVNIDISEYHPYWTNNTVIMMA